MITLKDFRTFFFWKKNLVKKLIHEKILKIDKNLRNNIFNCVAKFQPHIPSSFGRVGNWTDIQNPNDVSLENASRSNTAKALTVSHLFLFLDVILQHNQYNIYLIILWNP